VLIWHRRARKTTTAINELVKQAHIRPGPYWHVFPRYSEAKDAVWRDPQMLFSIIPEELVAKRNEAELVVYFKNGAYLQLKGADNPARLRGAGPLGFVLDEYDEMKTEVWPTLEPIVRANGGWAWFLGTPKGRQKLYDLYNLANTGNETEWGAWLLKASQSGVLAAQQLENSRRTAHSLAFYNQEYECEFLEGEGAIFRGVRDIITATPQKPLLDHIYVVGADLAKVQDYTVLVVYDRKTNQQVYQDRFNTIEWPFVKKKIRAISKYYNNALVVVDATGVGDPIADDLIRDNVPVLPFKITEITKRELVEKLSIWIEQRKFSMISTPETLLEFDNYSYEITLTGKIRYNAREGYNDDVVMAHALAVWELREVPKFVVAQKPSPLRQEYLRQLKGYDLSGSENDYEAV